VDAGVVSASPAKVIGWSVVAEPHGPSTASPWVCRVGFLYAPGLQGYWFPAPSELALSRCPSVLPSPSPSFVAKTGFTHPPSPPS